MATPQNAKATDSASFSDLEISMIAYFQKHPPKMPVEEKKTLLAYLKDSYLSNQEEFKEIATSLIEDKIIFKGTYSSFIKRTNPSTKPITKTDSEAFHLTLSKLRKRLLQSSSDQNSLDVTAPSPLKVDEQQPMEREIMDENAVIGIEFNSATDPVAIGTAILSARNFAKLSQTQLIEKTSISLRTLSRLESGKATNLPTLKTLDEIAKATGTELSISFKPK